MASPSRWQRAQRYEQDYWSSIATGIAAGSVSQLNWYQWRAEELVRKLRALGLASLTDGRARVVEVGSGPVGIVGFFPAAERVAIDPLEPYYASNPTLTALRNPLVQYRPGAAEALPCDSGRYDLAIIENCIDHVRDVEAAMNELERALTPDGVLYLTVNCRTRWGFVAHRTLSRLRVDAGHPYTFTPRRARRLLENHGWQPLQFDVGSYADALKEDLAGPGLRPRIKGLIGISEFLASAVARRQTGARRP
jgi:SAM-dependent methyltransferase